jgi:hypothetical protein
MPTLVEDVGELLHGRVSPRLREMGEDLAQRYGVPRGLASLGADLLGGAGGMRLPSYEEWIYVAFADSSRAYP